MERPQIFFSEVQRPPKWVWLLILLLAAIFWYGFIQQILFNLPFGSQPASNAVLIVLFIVFGMGLPLGHWLIKMVTQVRADGLYVRVSPFHLRFKVFKYEDITRITEIEYSPLKSFGGWGIRYNLKGETAYNMRGKKGIELKTCHGTYVIGSQHPESLCLELRQMETAYKNN